MSKFFKNPKITFSQKSDDYKEKFQTTIREVHKECFKNKTNAEHPHNNRRLLRKKDKTKVYKIKEKLMKSNAHWNNWKFQLHWKNI